MLVSVGEHEHLLSYESFVVLDLGYLSYWARNNFEVVSGIAIA